MKTTSFIVLLCSLAYYLNGQTNDSADEAFDPSRVTPELVPLDIIKVPEGLEVSIWASSPMLFNPTNMDIDRDGRIWVAEGVEFSTRRSISRRSRCVSTPNAR